MRTSILYILPLTLVAWAHAQDDYTLESLAAVSEQQVAKLDTNSVRREAGVTRFDVRVTPKDSEQPGSGIVRNVRYLADCSKGVLAVAGVAIHDAQGRMLKNAIVPPGTWEYETPAEDSREAQWLKQVCR
jgi:hypothetical protein